MSSKKSSRSGSDGGSGSLSVTSSKGNPAALLKGGNVLDAVVDQNGSRWIRFGTTSRSIWFDMESMHTGERQVFARLAGAGLSYLTQPRRNAFKEIVDQQATFRRGLVAHRPGWFEVHYVRGDGVVISPRNRIEDVIVAFDPDRKFTPLGTLMGWQAGVGPVVRHQPLLLFVLAFAFAGALRRFAPSDYHNPLAELAGPASCGKSTVGALAASVWAGDPRSDTGGGESWNLTPQFIDPRRAAHADNLLVLDEGNLTGANASKRGEFLGQAVFRLFATGERHRFGDSGAKDDIMLCALSTTNDPLHRMVEKGTEAANAILSRMLTIPIAEDRPNGVLDQVPRGYPTARQAIEALRQAIDLDYGSAGEKFLRRLVKRIERDEEAFRDRLRLALEKEVRRLEDLDRLPSVRATKTIALAVVAGRWAKRLKVIPKKWGSIQKAGDTIYLLAKGKADYDPLKQAISRIDDFVRSRQNKLINIAALSGPLEKSAFNTAIGFLRKIDEKCELLVPTKTFKAAFPDAEQLLQQLKKGGRAKTEGGRKTKLSIKAPKAICKNGRVYCIYI